MSHFTSHANVTRMSRECHAIVTRLSRINRYAATFTVLTAEADTRPVEYFDQYPVPNPAFIVNA